MRNSGIGLLGTIFIVFLILKLTNVITWSWWWVTIPLWGGAAIGITIFLLVAIIGILLELFKK